MGRDCEAVTSSGQLDTVTGGKAFTEPALKIDGVVPATVIGGLPRIREKVVSMEWFRRWTEGQHETIRPISLASLGRIPSCMRRFLGSWGVNGIVPGEWERKSSVRGGQCGRGTRVSEIRIWRKQSWNRPQASRP